MKSNRDSWFVYLHCLHRTSPGVRLSSYKDSIAEKDVQSSKLILFRIYLGYLSSLLSLCSHIDVTSVHRHLTWSSTSPSTSPHTPPLTSPAPFAIRSSPALPVSNLISCCTRRRRLVTSSIGHHTIIKQFLSLCMRKTFNSAFFLLILLRDNHCRI